MMTRVFLTFPVMLTGNGEAGRKGPLRWKDGSLLPRERAPRRGSVGRIEGARHYGEEVPEHGGGRPPDRVAHDVEEEYRPLLSADRPDLLAENLRQQQLGERDVQDLLDLAGMGDEIRWTGETGHERNDERLAGHRSEMVEFADGFRQGGIEGDLLEGFPHRRCPVVLARFLGATGEADLAAMAAQMLSPTGQHDMGQRRPRHRQVVEGGENGGGATVITTTVITTTAITTTAITTTLHRPGRGRGGESADHIVE